MKRAVALCAVVLCLILPITHADARTAPLDKFTLDILFTAMSGQTDKFPAGTPEQFLSMAGREDLAMNLAAKSLAPLSPCEAEMEGNQPRDPISEIVKRAAESRLTIINEAHDAPQGRAFIMDLMRKLHDRGVSIYAAETFYPAIEVRGPSWPKMSDGFYAREPAFGELIRRARAMRLTFVPYEIMEGVEAAKKNVSDFDRIAFREATQTRHLMERLINRYPQDRALIHVGHSHVYESPVPDFDGRDIRWMAARLKAESGIDPFTIDQTSYKSPIDRPVVCIPHATKFGNRPPATDIIVALPEVTFRDGRPAWRQARGQTPIAVPLELQSADHASIVEARYAAEPDDAVPADRLLIRPGETLPLLLPTGKFRIEAWTREDGWSRAISIDIK